MAILLEGTPILLFGAVIICAVVLPTVVIGNLIRRLVSDEALPKNLPWAGVGPNGGAFARLRANLSSFFRLKDLMEEGYTKVSRHSRNIDGAKLSPQTVPSYSLKPTPSFFFPH